jgi:hypothetical protein
MSARYSAYVPRTRLPSANELIRAMSSRGFRVDLHTDKTLDQLGGSVTLQVNGAPVPVNLVVGEVAESPLAGQRAALESGDVPDAEKKLTVLKTTDIHFVFEGEGPGEVWARELARSLALLSCGAFENAQKGSLLHFGY